MKNKRKQQKQKQRKAENQLTERDIKELMGMNRPTYGRRRGAVIRKR
ncbi:hypothetical protein LC040_05985 [Bacillus tianshenii]|nr:hypothetical protein LC040_05985 [Bacillus tianshenii]